MQRGSKEASRLQQPPAQHGVIRLGHAGRKACPMFPLPAIHPNWVIDPADNTLCEGPTAQLKSNALQKHDKSSASMQH